MTKGASDDPNYDGQKRRWSDYCIFCLLNHKDQSTIDPLKLELWEFLILNTKVLNEKVPDQVKIGLNSLLRLDPIKCNYNQIRDVIDK